MRRFNRLCVALLIHCSICVAAEFHVATDGRRTGSGAKDSPWDLQTALSQADAIKSGDTILLHPGTYRGGFTSTLKGATDAPIIVKPDPGARVTIDALPRDARDTGQFIVNGSDVLVRDLEFTCSDPKRETAVTGSHPDDIRRGGVTINGPRVRFVNCVVHDLSNGFGFWTPAEDSEIYGCLVYHNGWLSTDRGHGHAIYAQNKTGTKRIADNILFNQFSHGLHAYGSSRAFISGFDVEGNISFNNGVLAGPNQHAPDILIGGGSPSERVRVVNNFTYSTEARGVTRLGYGAENQDIHIERNYFVGALHLRKWAKPKLLDNVIVARNPLLWTELLPTQEPNSIDSDRNRFVQLEPQGNPFTLTQKDAPGWSGTFDQWKQRTRADANSAWTIGKPTGVDVFVRPNKYAPGRANVAVYNWDRRDHVELDLAAVLKQGQRFRIVSAQNFYGDPVARGTFDGSPVRLPMRPTKPIQPVGLADFPLPVTEPEFGAFVVLPE